VRQFVFLSSYNSNRGVNACAHLTKGRAKCSIVVVVGPLSDLFWIYLRTYAILGSTCWAHTHALTFHCKVRAFRLAVPRDLMGWEDAGTIFIHTEAMNRLWKRRVNGKERG